MRLRAAGCPRISARADGYFFREKTTIEKEDSMKVVVAGAGLGGLVAAEKLGRLGLDVTVYEKAASLENFPSPVNRYARGTFQEKELDFRFAFWRGSA